MLGGFRVFGLCGDTTAIIITAIVTATKTVIKLVFTSFKNPLLIS